jgi:hypothetical protein
MSAHCLALSLALLGLPDTPSAAVQERARHLARLGVDRWQGAGFRGKGVTIAILDTGFRGWRDHLGKALPAHVTVRSFRADGNLEARDSQHGILCGEVIHAIAPDAELLFANWDLGNDKQYLDAVRWARQRGARILSCSVITPNWSDGEGGGAVHRELARLLGDGRGRGDLLLFASAGNTTHRHWGGRFRDDGSGMHLWAEGIISNGLRPWGDDQVSAELYARPGADYELTVLDDTGRTAGRGRTHSRRGDRSSVAVRFWPRPERAYRVRVRYLAGPAGTFHVTSMNASLERTTADASVCFPGDAPGVVALGAVDPAGQKWWYSACGPNSASPKPDLVAVIPFPSLWRPRPFSGTSCAAPQAAGLAALLWSRSPNWTAAQVREVLRRSACDLHTPGHDCQTGYGLLRLPAHHLPSVPGRLSLPK